MTNSILHFTLESFLAVLPADPTGNEPVYIQRLQEVQREVARCTSFIVLSYVDAAHDVHLARLVIESFSPIGTDKEVQQCMSSMQAHALQVCSLLCELIEQKGMPVKSGLLLPVGIHLNDLHSLHTAQSLFHVTSDQKGNNRKLVRLDSEKGHQHDER